jgi:hypothetical protein
MNVRTAVVHAALLATMCALSEGVLARTYKLVDLGVDQIPSAISSNGWIASTYEPHHRKKWRAQLFHDGRWYSLDKHTSAPYAINDDGIVGGDAVSTNEHATLPHTWSTDTKRYDFNLPGDTNYGYVSSVSHAMAVGSFWNTSDDTLHCFLASAYGGQATDLGSMIKGAKNCQAFSINASAQVAGQATLRDRRIHGLLWQDGTYVDIGSGASPVAINDAGHIVFNRDNEVFVWKEGKEKNISDPSKYYYAFASAMNNAGVVVGFGDRQGVYRQALLFTHGKVFELSNSVSNLGGWILRKATGINDSGVIVGWGRINRETHGFMLIPQ